MIRRRRNRHGIVALTLMTLIIFAGILGLVLKHLADIDLLDDISAFALILTLASLVLYTYYTRQLAQSDYDPLAGFWLSLDDENSDRVILSVSNHCRRALNCWTKIEVTIRDQAFYLNGFYGGERPMFLQPLQIAVSSFQIRKDIVEQCRVSIGTLAEYERVYQAVPIHFRILFGYALAGRKIKWIPAAYYSYSLDQEKLALDIGGVEWQRLSARSKMNGLVLGRASAGASGIYCSLRAKLD